MTNAVCESRNKSWIVVNTCRLRAIQRNKTILNVIVTMLHPANSISLRLQVQKKASGYKPWVIDATFDVCAFLRNPHSNPIGKMAFKQFKEFSSINHLCPYEVCF
ncbi:maker161 [Drosophila busckii]|uniref:Maker161 n=1 Tax=Drosophila busckii TaxID=30019 RepID=A0A0M4ECU5_DROBS|nr:maker161 [Drosophila busckii]